jgi:hypothetical protein
VEEKTESLRTEYQRSVAKIYAYYLNGRTNKFKNFLIQSEDQRLVITYEAKDYDQVLLIFLHMLREYPIHGEFRNLVEAAQVCDNKYEISILSDALAKSDVRSIDVVKRCLRATVEGPFFPDWEFHTLFGLTRDEVKTVYDDWPNVSKFSHNTGLAINNSFNNLLYYPHRKNDILSEYLNISKDEFREEFNKWRELTGREVPKRQGDAESMFSNFE